jgi:uncharacterized protein (TIGR00369 family)
MGSDEIVEQFNAAQQPVIRTLNGRVLAFAAERKELRMEFDIGVQFCHTVDIVQGGFITAMLDASMAHVVLATEHGKVRVSSIDISVSFLRPARAGRFVAVGTVVKSGRTVAFLKAELFTDPGELVATATSSAYLTREHK